MDKSGFNILLIEQVADGDMVCIHHHFQPYKVGPKLINYKDNDKQFFLSSGVIHLSVV
jgi:hypothetical protein